MVSKSPLVWLHDKYKDRDWFHSVGEDQYGRYVVYVKYMNHETLHDIPDFESGVQVLVHFAASKLATRDQFVDKPGSSLADIKSGTLPPPPVDHIVDVVYEVAGPEDEEKSLRHLQTELDRLEKLCGSYTLNDIFYEIQDGKNAVTNMSARYPEVRTRLEKLYNQYGFDVIYEELDG
jgi:hypothetical protein